LNQAEARPVIIRTFQPGDEAPQAAIYNEAAGKLPRFKPATEEEVRRRCRAQDFDPQSRLYAEVDGRAVAYATFHANGRVSYPWCRAGAESAAEPLFQAVVSAMTKRGIRRAFAAYRADWHEQLTFFLAHGFHQSREMVNFIADRKDLPAASSAKTLPMDKVHRQDFGSLAGMAARLRSTASVEELERSWFQNPYFQSDALFTVRAPERGEPPAVGIFIANSAYTSAAVVDANMPCFRLGAFGTEGMQVKRIDGLFSFMASAESDAESVALDLLRHGLSVQRKKTGGETVAAQAPSDVPYLMRFYERHFRRQGSFPILERDL
jgi:hypothetical protein